MSSRTKCCQRKFRFSIRRSFSTKYIKQVDTYRKCKNIHLDKVLRNIMKLTVLHLEEEGQNKLNTVLLLRASF